MFPSCVPRREVGKVFISVTSGMEDFSLRKVLKRLCRIRTWENLFNETSPNYNIVPILMSNQIKSIKAMGFWCSISLDKLFFKLTTFISIESKKISWMLFYFNLKCIKNESISFQIKITSGSCPRYRLTLFLTSRVVNFDHLLYKPFLQYLNYTIKIGYFIISIFEFK